MLTTSLQAIKWTAERNERLLLLVVQDVKVDAAKLAKAWREQYGTLDHRVNAVVVFVQLMRSPGNDDFQPTVRAITEQFGALKKKAGGKAGVPKATNGVT